MKKYIYWFEPDTYIIILFATQLHHKPIQLIPSLEKKCVQSIWTLVMH